MSLFSLSFIFFYLPLTLLLFSVVPQRFRCFVLMVSSFFFVAMTTPLGLAIMIASLSCDYLLSRPIFLHLHGDRCSRLALGFAAAKDILLVVGMSVGSQLVTTSANPIVSLGVVVYSFTSLGYLIDLYHGDTDPIISLYDYMLFCCFFGKLHIGPIVSASDLGPQLRRLRPSLDRIGEGCVYFCHGLAKKIILADHVLLLGNQLRAIPYASKTVGSVWLLVICYLFATYFTLSGYSDIARGLGAIFGISLPENFHYPLQSVSVSDFFRNFNISSNRFVRRYVYQALGAEDNGIASTAVNIMLITMLMGLWYGVSLNFLLWGSILGLFIIFETYMGDRMLSIPVWLRRLGTLSLLVLSFTVFCSSSISQCLFYLRSMFGLEPQLLYDSRLLYMLASNGVILLLCVVFSTSFFSRRGRMVQQRHPILGTLVTLVVNLTLLGVSISFMV